MLRPSADRPFAAPCAARAVDAARMPVELPGESAEAASSTDPFVARRHRVKAAVEAVAAAMAAGGKPCKKYMHDVTQWARSLDHSAAKLAGLSNALRHSGSRLPASPPTPQPASGSRGLRANDGRSSSRDSDRSM